MNRHLIQLCLVVTLGACARVNEPAAADLRSSGQALQVVELGGIEVDGGVAPGSVRVAAGGNQFWVSYIAGADLYVSSFSFAGAAIQAPTVRLAASPNEYAIAGSPTTSLGLVRSDSDNTQLNVVSLGGSGGSTFQDGNDADTTWPVLASDGQEFFGVWVSGQNDPRSAGDRLFAQHIEADAGVAEPPVLLAYGGEAYAKPSIASAGRGRPYLIAWEAADGGQSLPVIESALIYADGGLGNLLKLSSSATKSEGPSVASNGNGFLVAWADELNATRLYMNSVGLDGSVAFDGGQPVTVGSQSIERCITPFIDFDGTQYLLGCVSIDTGAIELYAVDSSGLATSFSPIGGIDARTDAIGPSFRMATAACGSTLLAFEDLRDAGSGPGVHVGLRLLGAPDAGACSINPPTTIGSTSSGSGSGGSTGLSTATSGSGGSTGQTNTSGGSGSSSTTGGSTTGGGTTSSNLSTSSGSGSSASGTTGASGGSASSGTETNGGSTGSADVFGCSSGGMGLTPLALLGLLFLRRRRGAGLWVFLAAIGTLGIATPAHAASKKAAHAKVAVLTIEAKLGLSPDLAELLTTRLVARIQDVTGQAVISSEDIKHALGLERTKQLLGCSESSCMAELGGALGVDYLVTGTIAKVGSARTFDAQLMNTAKAVVLRRYSHRLPADADDSAFLDEVAPAVAALFPDAQMPSEAAPAPQNAASAAPVETQQPAETATASEGNFLIDLLATSELTEQGGYARLRVGYWVIPSLAIVVGGLATVNAKPGVQGGLELQPLAITPNLKPFISAAGQAIFNGGTSAGVTGSIGLAWSPVNHLVLRLEVPVTYFFSVPANKNQFYAFAGLGVGVRL